MISPAALKVLDWLAQDCEDDCGYERELVHEGRSWLIGVNKVPGKVAQELLEFCCLKADEYSDKIERYTINGTGRDILADPEKGCARILDILSGRIKE